MEKMGGKIDGGRKSQRKNSTAPILKGRKITCGNKSHGPEGRKEGGRGSPHAGPPNLIARILRNR